MVSTYILPIYLFNSKAEKALAYVSACGVEIEVRCPHMRIRISSPVIPRFLSAVIVTFPTRCGMVQNIEDSVSKIFSRFCL